MQVDSNPKQVEWNLAQVEWKMSLEPLKPFSSLLAQDSIQLALYWCLLALESKLLLQINLTQVTLILTQVVSNPMQLEWNLAQVN